MGCVGQRSRGGCRMRRVLPRRRAAETFTLRLWNQNFTVTVGFYCQRHAGRSLYRRRQERAGRPEHGPRRRRGAEPCFAARHPHRVDPARCYAQGLRRGCIRGSGRRRAANNSPRRGMRGPLNSASVSEVGHAPIGNQGQDQLPAQRRACRRLTGVTADVRTGPDFRNRAGSG